MLTGKKNYAPLRGILLAAILVGGIPAETIAETITVGATIDATLIEDELGLLVIGGVRRAMVRFDLAGTLPDKAIIERVSLELHLTPSNERTSTVSLHRILQPWSEGPAFSSGGAGAPSTAGDSTWLHRLYDYEFWTIAGGHFVARASAEALIAGEGFYTWQNTPGLLADLRAWQHAPRRNFGWILIGDEATRQSVKRFDSRESSNPDSRPILTIEYRLPDGQRP
jgi:hypothetical protein